MLVSTGLLCLSTQALGPLGCLVRSNVRQVNICPGPLGQMGFLASLQRSVQRETKKNPRGHPMLTYGCSATLGFVSQEE